MRRNEQLNFDQKRMAVTVWSGSRQTSFKLNSPLVLEVTAQHPQNLPAKFEMRRTSPHHWKTHSLVDFRQNRDPVLSLLDLFPVFNCTLQGRKTDFTNSRKLWLVGVATDRDARHLGPGRM